MTGPGDVSSTLGDLERKLKDLERELASVSKPEPDAVAAPPVALPPVAPPPAPEAPPAPVIPPLPDAVAAGLPTPPPAPQALHDVVIPPAPRDPAADYLIADARESLGGLRLQVDELVRFRERLQHSTHELLSEYTRMLDSIQATAASDPVAPAPIPGPAASAPPPSAWSTSSVLPPAPVAAVPPEPVLPGSPAAAAIAAVESTLPPAPAPVAAPAPVVSGPGPDDDVTFIGQVLVDAGPFTDIGTLSAFEQALGHVPGTQDVYVRGFEGSRAHIDVVLGEPVALGRELRRTAPLGFQITATAPDHVSITIDGGSHA